MSCSQSERKKHINWKLQILLAIFAMVAIFTLVSCTNLLDASETIRQDAYDAFFGIGTAESIELRQNPTQIGYIEGDLLNLSGLQVRILWDNGTYRDIDYEDFSTYSLTTSLENGTELLAASHDGQSIQILHTESGLSVATSPLGIGALVTITYDVNGGAYPPDSQKVVENQTTLTASEDDMRAPEYISGLRKRFLEWNTLANGNGTSYASGAEITPAADITLYAQWTVIGARGPGGGFVFHDEGSVNSAGWRYLEVAPESADQSAQWSQLSYEYGGHNGGSVGDGAANTVWLNYQMTERHENFTAAQRCALYQVSSKNGDFDDWFLPSIDSLDEIYTELAANELAGSWHTRGYWTSSEGNQDEAWYVNFGTGNTATQIKDVFTTTYLRPVRAFREDTNPLYVVYFDPNGATSGDPPPPVFMQAGDGGSLPNQNTLVFTGRTFKGWSTEPDGGNTINGGGGDYTMPAENVILFAQWD